MKISQRLLGLAFASADTLLEVNAEGCVSLAVGAGPVPGLDPQTAWVSRPLSALLGKASRVAVAQALADLDDGIRSSTIEVLVDCGGTHVRRAHLRAFKLPELAPAVSCALAYDGPAFTLTAVEAPPLLDAVGLIERVRTAMEDGQRSEDVAFAFVDVPGLTADQPDVCQRAGARIEAVLQSASVDGASAARLTPERFAILRAADADGSEIAGDVSDAAAAEGLIVTANSGEADLGPGIATGLLIRALRVALKACIDDNGQSRPDAIFSSNLSRTLREAKRFTTIVCAGDFTLHYQPIIDLETGNVRHFEALSRFSTGVPKDAVAMAEELGLIQAFDMAVLEKAIQRLRRPGSGLLKFALNLSGASLVNDDYFNRLLRMTQRSPDLRSRLLVEITETAAVGDLEAASRRLGALRREGVKVCLDDFGVGATTFEYLQKLPVDTVKIDGSYVQDVLTNDRSRTMLGHLVSLCRSLDVNTIAEMIETEAQAVAIRELGVDMGQGYLFGHPQAEPVTTPYGHQPRVGRRVGEISAWG